MTPDSPAPAPNQPNPWKTRIVKYWLPLVTMTMLFLLLSRENEQAHPSILLGNRYLIRAERVDIGNDFLYFRNFWGAEFWDKIKNWLITINDPAHAYSTTPHQSNQTHRSSFHGICFWISTYDTATKSYIDWPRAVEASVDSTGLSNTHLYSHNIEIKNGLIVRPHTPTVFNPTVSDYYLTIFAPDGNHGILHVTNPHVIKASAPPATWSKQARPLPSSQMVDGMEVTLTGFTPGNYDSFSGQFLIKKNGKDVSSDYGVASWIVDIWGNHSRRQGVLGFPLIHSSYWKVECVLFEYGTAAYTESHLCRLGNLTYPKEQTFTPLNVSWQNKAESLRVSALLGVGRHYFAGNRWLRAEPLPAPSLEQQTPFYGYAWNHTDELDLDENGNNISIRFYDAKMPSLLLHARLSTPIAVVGTNNKWEPNVVKPGITLERGYRVFSSDELHWVDAQPEQIIRLEWAPTIQQQEITLGIAQRREFEFYVTPADILPQAATKEE